MVYAFSDGWVCYYVIANVGELVFVCLVGFTIVSCVLNWYFVALCFSVGLFGCLGLVVLVC